MPSAKPFEELFLCFSDNRKKFGFLSFKLTSLALMSEQTLCCNFSGGNIAIK